MGPIGLLITLLITKISKKFNYCNEKKFFYIRQQQTPILNFEGRRKTICFTIHPKILKNRWIHAFPKAITTKLNANSAVSDLNTTVC